MILLDTDVLIDILRGHVPAVEWLESLGEEEIVLSGFVVMEAIQGCRDKTEQERVEKELRRYGLAWPSSEACDNALAVFVRHHLSHGVGMLDALIGQTAVALNAPLCTLNKKHYGPIARLRTIHPYGRA